MSLSHVAKLDLDSMIIPLLFEEIKRRPLESSSVTKERRG